MFSKKLSEMADTADAVDALFLNPYRKFVRSLILLIKLITLS